MGLIRTIRRLREERSRLRNKVRELETELAELKDSKPFVVEAEAVRRQLDEKPEEKPWDERADTYREIGRLRRALHKIANAEFPAYYSWENCMEYAQDILDGEERDDAKV